MQVNNQLIIRYFFLFFGILPAIAQSQDFDTTVAMQDKGASTFYVSGEIDGFGPTDLMVDTGSGYMTINEETLEILLKENRAQYVKELSGTLANGDKLIVPVYLLSGINIGGQCILNNVEAAVFPGKTRSILGLSALSKAAPFIFSMDPPQLVLSNCATENPRIETAG